MYQKETKKSREGKGEGYKANTGRVVPGRRQNMEKIETFLSRGDTEEKFEYRYHGYSERDISTYLII